jgi:membrane-associated protease RseP (regulator of RpoE activity)
MPKVRMFGAGITNNLVLGFSCFVLLILLFSMVVPVTQPAIYGVYEGYPAGNAGILPGSVITAVNGVPIATRGEVATILNTTKPGDIVTLSVENDHMIRDYNLTLAAWPAGTQMQTSGFMGVQYYDSAAIKSAVGSMFSPAGLFQFLIIPFAGDQGSQYLHILAFDVPDTAYYHVPFAGFWGIVHLLFWCAWININVGIFNAIPMVPLDGGYIFKESVDRLLDRRGLIRYSGFVVSAVSSVLIMVLISLILLPYLFHM